MICRETGEARIFVVDDRTADTLQGIIVVNFKRGSVIYSDGFSSYLGLNAIYGYPLFDRRCVHSEGSQQ